MAQIWKDRVQQTVSGTPGTGAITLSSASSGFQALGAGDDGKTGFFCVTDGTAWETFWGTYTHSGTSLARTTRIASSTGSAISLTSAAIVFLDIVSQAAQAMMLASSGAIPGGRLTLTTAVPVTTADVAGATTIFYTPYVNNVIILWDGNLWMPTIFAEVSLALGTLTSGKPYDVFGFLNAGALNTELLAWTNGTTRATAVTLQDGRYCKSGDKTRLYLGTFYTTATTTTEDSGGGVTSQVGGKRFVWNMYNRVRRHASVIDSASFYNYNAATWRQANGATGNKTEYIVGLGLDAVEASAICALYTASTDSVIAIGLGLNSTIVPFGVNGGAWSPSAGVTFFSPSAHHRWIPAPGYNYVAWLEKGDTNNGAYWEPVAASGIQGGLTVLVMA